MGGDSNGCTSHWPLDRERRACCVSGADGEAAVSARAVHQPDRISLAGIPRPPRSVSIPPEFTLPPSRARLNTTTRLEIDRNTADHRHTKRAHRTAVSPVHLQSFPGADVRYSDSRPKILRETSRFCCFRCAAAAPNPLQFRIHILSLVWIRRIRRLSPRQKSSQAIFHPSTESFASGRLQPRQTKRRLSASTAS